MGRWALPARLSLKIQTVEVRLDRSRDSAGLRQVSHACAGYTQDNYRRLLAECGNW